MLKFLVPSFIKNIDKKLLLNYPFWYIVKLHYIAYFTVLMWILSYVIGNLLTIDISSYNPTQATGIWTFVFAVLAIILFCVWMYYLTIYNTEDHFGKFSKWDDVKLLIVLVIGINLLMSFSYPMLLRCKTRLANTFSDTELAQQYNVLNLANKYITSDLNDFQTCGDLTDTIYDNTYKEFEESRDNYYGKHDLSKYINFNAFSPEKVESYSFYSYPLFLKNINSIFISKTEFNAALSNSLQIKECYKNHKTDSDKLKVIEHYFAITKLYEFDLTLSSGYNYTAQDYLDNYNHYEKTCAAVFPEPYNIKDADKLSGVNKYLPSTNVVDRIGAIYEAKFKLTSLLSTSYLLFAFYFSFFVSLLIILFRNNTWQHYLVSAVSFILLSIIISIISLALNISGASSNIYSTLSWLVYSITGVISIRYYFNNKKYMVVGVVASNLFYLALPIIPFLACVYSHEVFGWLKYYNYYPTTSAEILQQMIYEKTYSDALFYSQVIGITCFVVIAMPLYKLFYAKQKALPREK